MKQTVEAMLKEDRKAKKAEVKKTPKPELAQSVCQDAVENWEDNGDETVPHIAFGDLRT